MRANDRSISSAADKSVHWRIKPTIVCTADSRISSCSVRKMKSDSIRPNFRNKGRRKRITPKKFFVSLLLYCYCCAHGVRCSETIGRHLPVHCIRIIRTLFGADLVFVFFPHLDFLSCSRLLHCFRATILNVEAVKTQEAHTPWLSNAWIRLSSGLTINPISGLHSSIRYFVCCFVRSIL